MYRRFFVKCIAGTLAYFGLPNYRFKKPLYYFDASKAVNTISEYYKNGTCLKKGKSKNSSAVVYLNGEMYWVPLISDTVDPVDVDSIQKISKYTTIIHYQGRYGIFGTEEQVPGSRLV